MEPENSSSPGCLVAQGQANSDNHSTELCQTCKLIDLNTVSEPYWNIPVGDLCSIINTSNCTLCSLVTKALSPVLTPQLLEYANEDIRTLEVVLLPEEYYAEYKLQFSIRGPDGEIRDLPDWIYNLCQAKNCRLRVWHKDLKDCKMFPPTPTKPIRRARKLRDYFCDFEVMGYHLQQCRLKHGNVCGWPRHTLSTQPSNSLRLYRSPSHFRVVDTEKLQVILAPDYCKYVALSY